MLHVFGDSQAKCLFDGVPGCKLNWLGPVTMYRVGRDKAWFLKEPDIAGGAWAVLVFGGIDVRCHIGRIAEETGSPRRAVVASLVTAYLEAVRSRREGNTIVLGVMPPADGSGVVDADFPVFGLWRDRIEIAGMVNAELAVRTREFGIEFLAIPDFYANESGGLDPRLSDGGVHINGQSRWPVIKRLEAITGVKFPDFGRPEKHPVWQCSPKAAAQIECFWDSELSLSHIPAASEPPGGNVLRLANALQGGIKRLAGKLRRTTPANARRARVAFDISRHQLLNGSQLLNKKPLTVRGPSQEWSYAVSIPNMHPVHEAAVLGPADVSIDLLLLSGQVAVGLIKPDLSTLLVQARVTRSGQRKCIKFTVPSLADVGAVIVRNGGSGEAVEFSVYDVSVASAIRERAASQSAEMSSP
jgi:hypothetical protein